MTESHQAQMSTVPRLKNLGFKGVNFFNESCLPIPLKRAFLYNPEITLQRREGWQIYLTSYRRKSMFKEVKMVYMGSQSQYVSVKTQNLVLLFYNVRSSSYTSQDFNSCL